MGTEDGPPSHHRNVRRSLGACTGDGATYSFMVGSGETYFAAFVLALGASDEAGGLISSIPLLVGAVLQLVAPALARRAGSPRRWVTICAVVQALAFTPLIIGAISGAMPLMLVFAAVSIYWAAALGAGPTWSTWVAASFPARLRARFFALRNRLCQMAQLAGIIGAGFLLSHFERAGAGAASVAVTTATTTTAAVADPAAAPGDGARGHLLIAFAIIMAIAAIARLSSTLFLRMQDDLPGLASSHEHVSVRSLLARILAKRELRLLSYMLVAQVTVHVSAPYFNPYMLRSLELSKTDYLLMVATLFASKSLTLPLHGRFARRFGARKLLMVAGFGIVWLSAAWVISPSLWYLVPLQIINGAVWGAWELATFLLMLETIPDRERTGVLTVFNLLNCLAMVVGSIAGALLLRSMDPGRDAYLVLFVVSSGLRLLSLPALLAIGRERRPPSLAITVAAEEAAGRSAPGSQGRAALPAFSGPADGMPDDAPDDAPDDEPPPGVGGSRRA